MGKHVEILKNHADLLAMLGDVHRLVGDIGPFEDDPAAVGDFQQVQAAQKSAFAAARRPDNADHLALADHFVDPVEDVERPEVFPQTFHPDELSALFSAHFDSSSFPEGPRPC
jgi:hypothetical protein